MHYTSISDKIVHDQNMVLLRYYRGVMDEAEYRLGCRLWLRLWQDLVLVSDLPGHVTADVLRAVFVTNRSS